MIDDFSILAVIPARGGSKGIHKKNLRLVNGESLLALTIKNARASKYIDRIIVSSEDNEILDEAKRVGAEIPFIRPSHLAEDETPGIDPVMHAIEQINQYDYTLLLQVTSPLRAADDIDGCIEHCCQHKAPACVSINETREHPHLMFTINDHQKTLTPLFSIKKAARRQDLPSIYIINGAIYFAKTNWLKSNKTFITNETIGYVMPQERSLDIDSEFDFLILEAYQNKKNQYTKVAI